MDTLSRIIIPDHIYTNSHLHFSPVATIPLSANGQAPKTLRQYAGLITRTHIRAGVVDSQTLPPDLIAKLNAHAAHAKF